MAEPTVTTASGVSLTVLFVALLGPMAGPYVLIALSAVAGAMWPLSAARTESRIAGAWLLLRCTATALVLTSVLAGIVERTWGLPISEGLAPVALIIGAMGNGGGGRSFKPSAPSFKAGLEKGGANDLRSDRHARLHVSLSIRLGVRSGGVHEPGGRSCRRSPGVLVARRCCALGNRSAGHYGLVTRCLFAADHARDLCGAARHRAVLEKQSARRVL